MWRYIFLAVSLIGFAVEGPKIMTKFMDDRAKAKASFSKQSKPMRRSTLDSYGENDDRNPRSDNSRRSRRKSSGNSLSGRSVRAKMQNNGHFYFNTKMNGTPVKVMVDTGATGVAINRSTARRLGIKLTNADFKYKSQTANGIAYLLLQRSTKSKLVALW